MVWALGPRLRLVGERGEGEAPGALLRERPEEAGAAWGCGWSVWGVGGKSLDKVQGARAQGHVGARTQEDTPGGEGRPEAPH